MMKNLIFTILVVLISGISLAQETTFENEIKELSKLKWEWMTDKNVEKLANLFHDKSKFVHMSGSWKKDRELEIIESGSIWYKNAEVHDVAVETFGDDTAVLWNRITLTAHVRGNDVENEFTVTEFYKKEGGNWKLLDLTFSSVRDTHEIEHSKNVEQEIKELSQQKWQWMADKDADKLADLFHENSKFVHMGGTWGKDREVEIIRSGFIHYKKADVHEIMVELLNENTAILWNRIDLLAVVGKNEVTNPFMVTEVYVKQDNKWKLADLTFSKLVTPDGE